MIIAIIVNMQDGYSNIFTISNIKIGQLATFEHMTFELKNGLENVSFNSLR